MSNRIPRSWRCEPESDAVGMLEVREVEVRRACRTLPKSVNNAISSAENASQRYSGHEDHVSSRNRYSSTLRSVRAPPSVGLR